MGDAFNNSGIAAFAVFTFLAVALWLLMRNMTARLRRMSYAQKRADEEAIPETQGGKGTTAGTTSGDGRQGE